MLVVVDLGIGNIGSVAKALDYLGAQYRIISEPEDLSIASKIILPGVGSFFEAVKRLDQSGFRPALLESVSIKNVPILGICVGMQLLASVGLEGGRANGLGFIDATVEKIDDCDGVLAIPHMGWNELSSIDHPLFEGVNQESCFYFVHSYAMKVCNSEKSNWKIITTDYGQPIIAFLSRDNIFGAQFHPEKSQQSGLKFIRNFVDLC